MARPRLYEVGHRLHGWEITAISRKTRHGANLLEVQQIDRPGIVWEMTVFQYKSDNKRLNRTISHTYAEKLQVTHPTLPTRHWNDCYVPLALLELDVDYFSEPGLKVFVGRHGEQAMYSQEYPEEFLNYHKRGFKLLITDYPQTGYVNSSTAASKAAARDMELITQAERDRKELSRIERNLIRMSSDYTALRNSILRSLMEVYGPAYREPEDLPPALPGMATVQPPKPAPLYLPDGPVNRAEAEEAARAPAATQASTEPLQALKEPLEASDQTAPVPEVAIRPAIKPPETAKYIAKKTTYPEDDEFGTEALADSDAMTKPNSGVPAPRNKGIYPNRDPSTPLWVQAPDIFLEYNGLPKKPSDLTQEQLNEIGYVPGKHPCRDDRK